MTGKAAVWAATGQKCQIFPVFLRRFIWNDYRLTLADKSRFLHIVAVRYYGLRREAAALPGRFLPELGRSSERPFFWLSFSYSRSELEKLAPLRAAQRRGRRRTEQAKLRGRMFQRAGWHFLRTLSSLQPTPSSFLSFPSPDLRPHATKESCAAAKSPVMNKPDGMP